MESRTFGNATLYLGDCRQVEASPSWVVATDPPFGISNNCDYTRFSGGLSPSRNHHLGIVGDNEPFDPSWLLGFKKVALFGFQYFATGLPIGSVLVWNKKRDNQLGTFCSDCELAWVNSGVGVYLFNHVWNGFDRASERGKTLHPNQKPVALWKWVFQKMKLKPGDTVFDPYMGSGSCGVAAIEAGLNYVGCEIVPEYYEIGCERLEQLQNL